jgi:integrase
LIENGEKKMAGTVQFAKLESPTARARLKRDGWRTLVPGRVHLGYQRKPDTKRGRWILRQYLDGKYRITPLGEADDAVPANGDNILSFEQAEAKARVVLDRPTAASGRLTVRAALANYIAFKESQGQPTGDLRSRSAAHILPALGDKVVAELTAERLRAWLAALATARAQVRPRAGQPQYKSEPAGDDEIRRRRASANRVLTMLKAALNYAFDEGKVANNDAWGRKLKPFRDVGMARTRYLSVAEAKRLINACDAEFRPLVRGALETGCRYGELIRLEVADFNPDAGTVAIRKSKTGKPRHVILTEDGAAFFKQRCAGRGGQELMFTHADGRPWKASEQARPMADACERAHINPPVGIHQLRHTWASLSVMAGVPLMVVARNLGHVDTRMTERHYGHLAPSYIADAIRAGAPKFGFEPDRVVALGGR